MYQWHNNLHQLQLSLMIKASARITKIPSSFSCCEAQKMGNLLRLLNRLPESLGAAAGWSSGCTWRWLKQAYVRTKSPTPSHRSPGTFRFSLFSPVFLWFSLPGISHYLWGRIELWLNLGEIIAAWPFVPAWIPLSSHRWLKSCHSGHGCVVLSKLRGLNECFGSISFVHNLRII